MTEDISYNIQQIRQKLSSYKRNIELVAVTKNFGVEEINRAIECGITQIGENRVQELMSKYDFIKNRDKIKINLIGHLQTNKVKYVIGKVDLIQSVDSVRLAQEIDRLSCKKGIKTDILVQLNMGNEENKFGIVPEQTEDFLREISVLGNIKVKGLMGVVPKSENKEEIRCFFSKLCNIFLDIKSKKIDNIDMEILSMGMSGDYEIACECGSTMVRVGSAIFGQRKIKNEIYTEETK